MNVPSIQTLEMLDATYAIPGVVTFSRRFELIRGELNHPEAVGEFYTQGAHVTHWCPCGQAPILWMSRRSMIASGQPIPGGIPICFPWFSRNRTSPMLPGHGLARIREWLVHDTRNSADGIRIAMHCSIAPFSLEFVIHSGRTLKLELTVQNRSSLPATYEAVLHTYFAVSDVRCVTVHGLENSTYVDKLLRNETKMATGRPIDFVDAVDRIYMHTAAACEIRDPGLRRRVRVMKSGSSSTIVWSPWRSRSEQMNDPANAESLGMLCLETGAVRQDEITLEPSACHSIGAEIDVMPL